MTTRNKGNTSKKLNKGNKTELKAYLLLNSSKRNKIKKVTVLICKNQVLIMAAILINVASISFKGTVISKLNCYRKSFSIKLSLCWMKDKKENKGIN